MSGPSRTLGIPGTRRKRLVHGFTKRFRGNVSPIEGDAAWAVGICRLPSWSGGRAVRVLDDLGRPDLLGS